MTIYILREDRLHKKHLFHLADALGNRKSLTVSSLTLVVANYPLEILDLAHQEPIRRRWRVPHPQTTP